MLLDGKATVNSDVAMTLPLKDLRQAIAHFNTPNDEFGVVPPSPSVFARPLLRLSHQSDGFSALVLMQGLIVP
jgi:hypothetical protein